MGEPRARPYKSIHILKLHFILGITEAQKKIQESNANYYGDV